MFTRPAFGWNSTCAALITSFVAAGVCALAAASSARAADTFPKVSLVGTPSLHVARRPVPQANAPAAWILFHTREHLRNPRLIVVRVVGVGGRSYRPRGTTNCVRSSVVTDSGQIALTPGGRYRVDFFVRAGIGVNRSRRLLTSRTLEARSFRVPFGARGAHRAPGCPSRVRHLGLGAAHGARRGGIPQFVAQYRANVSSISVHRRAVQEDGELGEFTDLVGSGRPQRGTGYRLSAVTGDAVRGRKMASTSAASDSLVGQRLRVKVKQLLIYAAAGQGSYIGSLVKGQTFRVHRLSRSGTWAYGFAYGAFQNVGWVKTSGLAHGASPQFAG